MVGFGVRISLMENIFRFRFAARSENFGLGMMEDCRPDAGAKKNAPSIISEGAFFFDGAAT